MADENVTNTETNKDEGKETLTRKEAISKALDEVTKKDEEKETTEEKPKEKAVAKAKVADEETELTAEEEKEMADALQLFRALNDPKRGAAIVKAMAEEAGLFEANTKKEVKATVKSIKEVVKEKLGDEYQFLSGKLAEILEEIVPSIAKEKTEALEKSFAERERRELSEKVETAYKEVFSQYAEIPATVKEKFSALIDEFPPRPSSDPKVYFNRIIKMAAEETNTTLKKVTSTDKNKDLAEELKRKNDRNKRDASSQLASKSAEAEVETTSTHTVFKNRREAIKAAMKQAEEKEATA